MTAIIEMTNIVATIDFFKHSLKSLAHYFVAVFANRVPIFNHNEWESKASKKDGYKCCIK